MNCVVRIQREYVLLVACLLHGWLPSFTLSQPLIIHHHTYSTFPRLHQKAAWLSDFINSPNGIRWGDLFEKNLSKSDRRLLSNSFEPQFGWVKNQLRKRPTLSPIRNVKLPIQKRIWGMNEWMYGNKLWDGYQTPEKYELQIYLSSLLCCLIQKRV